MLSHGLTRDNYARVTVRTEQFNVTQMSANCFCNLHLLPSIRPTARKDTKKLKRQKTPVLRIRTDEGNTAYPEERR